MSQTIVDTVHKTISSRQRMVIGGRFATCVAIEILTVTKKMCASSRTRQQICSACKTNNITKLDKLIRPQVVKRFNCIPCPDVRFYVDWSFERLIKVLFPTICRICKCK
ncbi:hypothetical protein ACFLQ6_01775 [Thermoproteota archaeon]